MICWVDVETTGLDERKGHLLEVALVLTDDQLNDLGYCRVVVKPDTVISLDPYVLKMHVNNGLLDDVVDLGMPLSQAQDTLIAFLKLHIKDNSVPLAGSTVSFDRRWLKEHMPLLESEFNYRNIDVSSLTEIAKRWTPEIYTNRPQNKEKQHRALADVRESIAYLKYYRDCGFVAKNTNMEGAVAK